MDLLLYQNSQNKLKYAQPKYSGIIRIGAINVIYIFKYTTVQITYTPKKISKKCGQLEDNHTTE